MPDRFIVPALPDARRHGSRWVDAAWSAAGCGRRVTAVADTPFQAAVCRDLQELRRRGTLRLADYQRAVKIVRKNEGNTYSEHSCMSVTEAADLAADMARLAGNVT